jgi:YD repeat-containing protein
VTDARDHETKLTWDALGRLRQIENPLGEQTELTYGSPDGMAEGWLLVQTEAGRTLAEGEGRITKLVYDGLGNLTQVQRKTGTGMAGFATFATIANDTAGRRLAATDARSRNPPRAPVQRGFSYALCRTMQCRDVLGRRARPIPDSGVVKTRASRRAPLDRRKCVHA